MFRRALKLCRQCDGTYKARIVVCGNFDPFRGETYSPTALKSVMWLVLAIVVILGLHVQVFDISAAFVAEDITSSVRRGGRKAL